MDLILIFIIAIILLVPTIYIIRAKKKGVKCIGCPSGGTCSSCTGCSSENCDD